MAEAWESYIKEEDEFPILIAVDLALAEADRRESFSTVVLCRIPISELGQNLLPTVDALDTIHLFEDVAERIAVGTGNSVYAGRHCAAETATLCFYANQDHDLAREFNQSAELKALAEFRCEVKSDPDWSHYFNSLYPSPEMRNALDNDMVRHALREDGDDGTVARDIEHWAYFDTANSASLFVDWLNRNAFQNIHHSTALHEEDRWVVQFERRDAPADIDDLTWELKQVASSMAGDYDGWAAGLAPSLSE